MIHQTLVQCIESNDALTLTMCGMSVVAAGLFILCLYLMSKCGKLYEELEQMETELSSTEEYCYYLQKLNGVR